MKTRVPKVLILLVPGIFALWTMTSLRVPNACGSAGSNLEYIKEKIRVAATAQELQISRYNTYKALNGLEKTKHNLLDCGCKITQEHMDRALSQLKEAVRADSLWESKELLGLALENTLRGLEALRGFPAGRSRGQWQDCGYRWDPPRGLAAAHTRCHSKGAGKREPLGLRKLPGQRFARSGMHRGPSVPRLDLPGDPLEPAERGSLHV